MTRLLDHVALKYFFLPKKDFFESLKAITAAGGDTGFLDIISAFEQKPKLTYANR